MDAILETVAEAGLVLTESDRLERDLRRRFALRMRASGAAAWKTPAIYSLMGWAEREWERLLDGRVLLHDTQELALWRWAIQPEVDAGHFINPMGLARGARQAFRLALSYNISLDEVWHSPTVEESSFCTWHQRVRDRLQDRGWVIRGSLLRELMAAGDRGEWTPPEKITLAGFADIKPGVARFFEWLRERGTAMSAPATGDGAQGAVICRAAEVAEAQLRFVACECKRLLDACKSSAQRPPRIGILVPNLDLSRASIGAALTDVVAPYLNLPESRHLPAPWRFGRGRALAEHPMVAAALAVLSIEGPAITFETASELLLLPVLFGADSLQARHKIEYQLREDGVGTVTWERLASMARALNEPLAEQFEQFGAVCAASKMEQLPSQWNDQFRDRLRLLNWDALRDQSSEVFQAQERFEACLREFAAMDEQLEACAHERAIVWLRECLYARRFEPRANHDQPIMVLEYAEATGLQFDELFVIDASVGNLPLGGVLSPFLPREKQQAAQVPGASPETDLQRSIQMTGEWRAQSARITVLCPSTDEFGAQMLPSRIFKEWDGAAPLPAPDRECSVGESIAAAGPAARFPVADVVPGISGEHVRDLRGGTKMFENYIEAPFFALIRNRLHGQDLPEASRGLDSQMQGSLVHAVLEGFWNQITSRDELRAITEENLRGLIQAHLKSALQRLAPDAVHRWGASMLRLESNRVIRIVEGWLRFEAQRTHNFRVAGTEVQARVMVGGIPLTVKLDRVDLIDLPDRQVCLIIDYKTGGFATVGAWMPDRLKAAQLPLYAGFEVTTLCKLPPVDGIAIAGVDAVQPSFQVLSNFGNRLIANKAGDLGQAMPAWETTKRQWRDRLDEIGAGILAGRSEIDADRAAASFLNGGLLSLVRNDWVRLRRQERAA